MKRKNFLKTLIGIPAAIMVAPKALEKLLLKQGTPKSKAIILTNCNPLHPIHWGNVDHDRFMTDEDYRRGLLAQRMLSNNM